MTPEQAAAQILVEAHARVQAFNLVLATAIATALIAFLAAMMWRWANRTERIRHFRSRDVEARMLVEASVETINRQASDLRRFRNMLVQTDLYFMSHRPTFDDREREPLVTGIKALLGEQQAPLQITFERRGAPESEAA